jgi:hypothetical protein
MVFFKKILINLYNYKNNLVLNFLILIIFKIIILLRVFYLFLLKEYITSLIKI